MSDHFEREKAAFEKARDELVAENSNKFVLINGDEILGVYDTENDAIGAGYDKIGLAPFFVRQITAYDDPVHYSASLVRI